MHRSLAALGSVFALGLLLAACSSSQGSAAADGGARADAAGSLPGTDGGLPPNDGALSPEDGGSPGTDGGVPGMDSAAAPDVLRPADPCIDAGTCAPGTWVDVTPPAVDLTVDGSCTSYGTKAVQVDPARPQDVYASFNCQGVWKSTDYGQTWVGPINTGTNADIITSSLATLAIARSASNPAAILYGCSIAGPGVGFWKSTNAGVDWTTYPVLPDGGQATAVNQQFYSPAVDPYDANHLIMAAHQTDVLVESIDGGETWKGISLAPGMITGDMGTGGINFVNTGDAATTRGTWLWLAAAVGTVGTWRTADEGVTWTQVDANEHTNGSMHSEVFQPAPYDGVIYMAGSGSALGDGVLRSTDYGVTWTHVGLKTPEAVVIGTPLDVYAMFGWAAGAGVAVDPSLERGSAPGTGTWTSPGTPPAMTQGPGQAAVTNDGTYSILLVGDYNAGLWRYVEPNH